ncbi:MAG: hypothetical protein V2A62_05000 [Candidatus Woesearchaeota archaeon]
MITPEVWFSIVLGLLVALWFEKYYVGRATVLPNVAVIFFLMWPSWDLINIYVKWWLYVGILLGILALGFLLSQRHLPSILYDLTYPFYSGKTIMGLYIPLVIFKEILPPFLFSTGFWIIAAVLIILLWVIGVKYLENNYPFESILE